MHHPTDRIAQSTAIITPVVEHWLENEERKNIRCLHFISATFGIAARVLLYTLPDRQDNTYHGFPFWLSEWSLTRSQCKTRMVVYVTCGLLWSKTLLKKLLIKVPLLTDNKLQFLFMVWVLTSCIFFLLNITALTAYIIYLTNSHSES